LWTLRLLARTLFTPASATHFFLLFARLIFLRSLNTIFNDLFFRFRYGSRTLRFYFRGFLNFFCRSGILLYTGDVFVATSSATATTPPTASAPPAYRRLSTLAGLLVGLRVRKRIGNCHLRLLVGIDRFITGEVATEFNRLTLTLPLLLLGFSARMAAAFAESAAFTPAVAAALPLLISLLVAALRLGYDLFVVVVFLDPFDEVGDIEEGVAFKPDFNECGLHARKHARDFAFVNGSREGVFILAFEIDFYDLVIFNDRKFGLMRRRCDK
jgi:hypothetical protein